MLKKTNSFYFLVLTLSVVLLLSGCANIFSSRYQKVTFQCATSGAKVIYPKDGISHKKGGNKFDKMRVYHTVAFEKEGYKTSNYSFEVRKRSPTIAFAVLDLAVPIYGWFYGLLIDFKSPKTRRFDKVQKVPALTAYDIRKSDEKFMIVNNTAIDAKGADITWHQYPGLRDYKNNNHKDSKSVRKSNRKKDREDIKVDNTIFTDALNVSMKKMNFIDTLNTVFPAIGNTVYLNATVKKITVNDVQSSLIKHATKASLTQIPNDLLSLELEIEWEVLDYYKQKIYSATTKEKSDQYAVNYASNKFHFENFFKEAMQDNLEYSLIKIRKELSAKGLLKTSGTVKETPLAAISILKPQVAENSRINEFMKSAVTIKVDDGHGSGAIISSDGYIVTAYHVVVGTKKIEVVFNDGSKADAEVIRKNEDADIALIKVNKTDLIPLPLSNVKDPEIGIDVWAIGTPKSIQLGQSVSKGVLSGLRKANDVSYLQTDVSINGGNSGGPLINKQGTILGIVTSKLVGIGTEGVGFAIAADEVVNRLKIEYK